MYESLSMYHHRIFSHLAHTTIIDYQINDITSTGLTVYINHNNTGTIHPRLCAGRINQMDEQERWVLVQVS